MANMKLWVVVISVFVALVFHWGLNIEKKDNTEGYQGAKFYPGIALYELLTYQGTARFCWGITFSMLQKQYIKFAGRQSHTEVGAASPSLMASTVPKSATVFLVDVDKDFLSRAETVLKESGWASVTPYVQDITQPFDTIRHNQSEAIGMNFVMHCVPGTLGPSSKGVGFTHLKPLLVPGGVFFGSTVLGYEQPHNWLGKFLMGKLNSKKIFDNEKDTLADLRASLGAAFKRFEVKVFGVTAVWTATDDPNRDIDIAI